jgi:hypothetical protein
LLVALENGRVADEGPDSPAEDLCGNKASIKQTAQKPSAGGTWIRFIADARGTMSSYAAEFKARQNFGEGQEESNSIPKLES